MSLNDFKLRLGSLDIRININRNETRRREQIRKNFEQDSRIREMQDTRNRIKDSSLF